MSVLSMATKLHEDIEICQKAVPAHMLVLMSEECKKAGFEFRSDMVHRLNMAAAAPLAQLKSSQVSRLAYKIDSIATNLLTFLNAADPRDGLYICAEFCLMLVAEGFWTDVHNQSVLVSMLLIEDVKDDRPDENGALAVWHEQEHRWQKKARDLILRAQLQGMYARTLS